MAAATVAAANTAPTTLVQYLQLHNPPQVQYLTMAFIKATDIQKYLPAATHNSHFRNGRRLLGPLPSANFRNINENALAQNTTPMPFQEQIFLITNPIDVDYSLTNTDNEISGTGTWEFQIDANVKGMAFTRADLLINNSHSTGTLTTNKKAPVGFCGRFLNAEAMGEYGVNPNCNINAGVDLSKANWSAANFVDLTAALDQAFQEIGQENGDGCIIMYNDPGQRAVNACAKLASGNGGFSTYKDQFDRTITAYNGAKFMNLRREGPDVGGNQEQFIISNAEGPQGQSNAGAPSGGPTGGNTYTSFWVVLPGEKDGFSLWQMAPLTMTPKYPVNGGVFDQMAIRWSMGMWQQYPRSIVRLYGINLYGV